jgi:hypothetical protein
MHCDRLSEALPNDLIHNGAIWSVAWGLTVVVQQPSWQFSQRLSNPALQVQYCDWMIMRPTVRHSN